jgi:hypothetical protein
MKMLQVLGAVAVSIALVASTAWAAGGRDLGTQVATESARGEQAGAVTFEEVKSPRKLFVRVSSDPRQRITGGYAVTCWKGSAMATTTGTLRTRTPAIERLRMPRLRSDSCRVGASARLRGSGRVWVSVFARR